MTIFIPCVLLDVALFVSSSHTWLHLDQRGRNKTSNQIGISLKIFLKTFCQDFWDFQDEKILDFDEHFNMELRYLSVHCIWSNSFFVRNDEISHFSQNLRENGDFCQNFTFVIIPDIPWRKNFFAFRAFVRTLPLETKLVLTRVGS